MIRARTGAFTRGSSFNCMTSFMTSAIADVLALREPRGTHRSTSAARWTALSVAEAGVPPVSLMAWSTAASSGAVSSFGSCGEQPSRRRRVDSVEATR